MSSSASIPNPKSKAAPPPPPQITTHTPSPLPPRLRNSRVALSLKEIRKVARDGPHPPPKSARRKITSFSDSSASSAAVIARPLKLRNPAVDENPSRMPEKYEMLIKLFDSLDSSIRLLRLKGSMCSFTNISPKIECLTDRRFSYRHLAQLKYVLPEAVEIKRMLLFDERTSCMKPDLHITLNVDAIEYGDGDMKSGSKNMHLRKVFRSRVVDFYNAHPEGDEIPEELLPEPFNRAKHDLKSDTTTNNTSTSLTEVSDTKIGHSLNSSLPVETEAAEKQQPAVVSHFSQSFQRRFSKKVANIEPECTLPNSPKIFPQQPVFPAPEPCQTSSKGENSSSTPTKLSPKLTKGEPCLATCASPLDMAMANLPETPSKCLDMMNGADDSCPKKASFLSTPAEDTHTSAMLMSNTPALHPPKRCHMSPDDESTCLPNKLVRRPALARPLIFESPVKNVEAKANVSRSASVDDDILKILPESTLQSIREKERKAKEDQDPAISQAKRRRQMIACLPKLFNMIHFLFQSIKKSIITKEELIHKIIGGHFDIVDRREVEEQLKLLLELVPDWITEKLATTGDLLLCINKMSNPETIRAQLEGAK